MNSDTTKPTTAPLSAWTRLKGGSLQSPCGRIVLARPTTGDTRPGNCTAWVDGQPIAFGGGQPTAFTSYGAARRAATRRIR